MFKIIFDEQLETEKTYSVKVLSVGKVFVSSTQTEDIILYEEFRDLKTHKPTMAKTIPVDKELALKILKSVETKLILI